MLIGHLMNLTAKVGDLLHQLWIGHQRLQALNALTVEVLLGVGRHVKGGRRSHHVVVSGLRRETLMMSDGGGRIWIWRKWLILQQCSLLIRADRWRWMHLRNPIVGRVRLVGCVVVHRLKSLFT